MGERDVETRAESEVKKENKAPVEPEHPAVDSQPVVERSEQPQEQQGACSMVLPDIPGPSVGSQEHVQPPDITSTLGKLDLPLDLPDLPRVSAEDREQRPADILDQVPLTDKKPGDSTDPGPSKPPRQCTVEPDIVASTKKPPPSRPPPPSGAPPPRPPPPSRPALPLSKKSQECLRPTGLDGK